MIMRKEGETVHYHRPLEEMSIDELIHKISHRQHSFRHNLLGDLHLHRGQPRVLHSLQKKNGQTMRELATNLDVQPPTVTRTIDRMSKAGFVERRPDPDDQRVTRVYITQKALDLDKRLDVIKTQLEHQITKDFKVEELQQLRDYLYRVIENLNEGDESYRR